VSSSRFKRCQALIIAQLVLLSVQGWSGDFVNVFVTTTPRHGVMSLVGVLGLIESGGGFLVWHGVEGVVIVVLGATILTLSFKHHRGVVVSALLALLSVVSAGIGGVMFVASGFSAGGASMQMGGSFIAAYALYFIVLYYTK
jgi:hypothetical protein